MSSSGQYLFEDKMVVYRITNAINGSQYVGVTNNFQRRICQHKEAERNSRKTRIAMAIRKYGAVNFSFDVIEVFSDRKSALAKEMEIIEATSPRYNVTKGGDGVRMPISAETKKKMREGMIGRPNPWLGRKHSIESKEKMRIAATGRVGPWRGKTRSPETVEKIAAANRKNPPRFWLGKTRDDETKAKMSASRVGKANPSARKTLERTHRRMIELSAEVRRKRVKCLNDDAVYDSLTSASVAYGLKMASVSQVCLGKRTSIFGLKFGYL